MNKPTKFKQTEPEAWGTGSLPVEHSKKEFGKVPGRRLKIGNKEAYKSKNMRGMRAKLPGMPVSNLARAK